MAKCGVKFRAYPTSAQATILSRWIGCARVIYNAKVSEDHAHYQHFKATGERVKSTQAYAHFKTEDRKYLKDCPSQVLRNSTVHWYAAKQRFYKKLSGNPTKKHRGDRDSVLLTSELFSFEEVSTSEDGYIERQLKIGTQKFPVGVLRFIAHRDYKLPNQIVVSIKNGDWFVSFCYEVEAITEKTQEELEHIYAQMEPHELTELTVGIDRGVVKPFAMSNGEVLDMDEKTLQRLAKKHVRLKRYQKKLAKQQLKSQARKKTKRKLGRIHQKISNIRHDFCHKTSHQLAHSSAWVFGVEALSLKNMTKTPRPKKDEQGRYIRNGRRAKAGLNRALLSKGLGKMIAFLEYKARRLGKLVVKVPAHYTSQECAKCGHIHPENRQTQSLFECISCGNRDNADNNAAKVIVKRVVQYLLSLLQAKTATRLGSSQSNAWRGDYKTGIAFAIAASSNDTGSPLPF